MIRNQTTTRGLGLDVPTTSAKSETQPSSEFICDAVNDFVFHPKAMDVAKCLVTTGAYGVKLRESKSQWLTWKSGIRAPVYCDCRALNCHSLERKLVSKTLTECIRQSFPQTEVIVGMATAGVSWGRVVADELDLPFAYVRQAAKTHGTGTLVEGDPPRGKKAIIVDDLVASGSSILVAINALKTEADIEATCVQSIVNWGFEGMRRSLAAFPFKALTSFPQILMNACLHGLINQHEFVELLAFYNDPVHHKWLNHPDL